MSVDDEKVAERLMGLELRTKSEADEDSLTEEEDEEEAEDLDWLIGRVCSDNPAERFAGIQTLRRRVSDNDSASYRRLVLSEAMTVLVNSIGEFDKPELQFESTWTLTNLLACQRKCARVVVKRGVLPSLIGQLNSGVVQLREQASWALANIVGDSTSCRDAAANCGLAEAMLKLFDDNGEQPPAVLDAASLVLVNLFRDCEPRVDSQTAEKLAPLMRRLLVHPYRQLTPNVLWALSYMMEEGQCLGRLALKTGLMSDVRQLLDSDDTDVLVPTLRIYASVSGSIFLTSDSLFETDLLDRMLELLKHDDVKIRKLVLFYLTNLSSEPETLKKNLARPELLREIGRILLQADESEKREAFWFVPNLALSANVELKNLIIEHCLEGFMEAIELWDIELTHCIVLTLHHLLFAARYTLKDELDFEELKRKIEQYGGIKKLEKAQKMEKEQLVELSYEIVDHFFLGNKEKYHHLSDNENDEDENNDERHPECNVGDDFAEEKAGGADRASPDVRLIGDVQHPCAQDAAVPE